MNGTGFIMSFFKYIMCAHYYTSFYFKNDIIL